MDVIMKGSPLELRYGILGGGQLGKMLCEAAAPWDLHIHLLDPEPNAPAFQINAQNTCGSFQDKKTVLDFGKHCDVITIEIESVNTQALQELAESGKTILPHPDSIRIIQDKSLQKQVFQKANIPTADFLIFQDWQTLKSDFLNNQILLPKVQKVCIGGFDGRGVQVLRTKEDVDQILQLPSILETCISIQTEISVIIARDRNGNMVHFPPTSMVFDPQANLILYQLCPSGLSTSLESQAIELAKATAEALNIQGLLAVEMFLDMDNRLYVNEVAPRPHNSGHHTIEAFDHSQYEMLWRILMDIPLIQPTMIQASVMINLLGAPGYSGPVLYEGLDHLWNISGGYLHLYGKEITRPYRKMGHITLTGNQVQDLMNEGKRLTHLIKVIA